MSSSTLLEGIRQAVNDITIINTHEHTRQESERLRQAKDVFYLFIQYAAVDLISSGMSREQFMIIRDSEIALDERLDLFLPYWEKVKNTCYMKMINIIAKDIYGLEKLENKNDWAALSEQVVKANKPGLYKRILQDLSNIEISIIDLPIEVGQEKRTLEVDREFFAPVMRFERYASVLCIADIRDIEKDTGVSIHGMDDMLAAMDKDFQQCLDKGIAGIKLSLAYRRNLSFEKASRHDAEVVFNQLFKADSIIDSWSPNPPVSWQEAKPLQDFMIHEVFKRAAAYNLPIQIHTGYQEGSGNILMNANPTEMINVFLEYQDINFVIFHAAFPWTRETAIMAKTLPNVYADICWVHTISATAAETVLNEWLEIIPANKIFGFGGDAMFVERIYAHAKIAREITARILTHRVESGYFSEQDAIAFARRILRDNALALYPLAEQVLQPAK